MIGGCHSLVTTNGQIAGDPMETAALQSIGWAYVSQENAARPFQVWHVEPLDMYGGARFAIHVVVHGIVCGVVHDAVGLCTLLDIFRDLFNNFKLYF